MNLRFLLLLVFVPLALAHATIVPSGQTIDWSTAGLNGATPWTTRTTISQTADAATYGNDSTAALTHLQAKINATASGQVCYIPAGTYRISGTLSVPSNITIRGAGVDQTIIKSVGSAGNGAFAFGTDGATMQYSNIHNYSASISSGGTAGSTSITLSSMANMGGLAVGDLVCITGENDNTTVTNVSFNGTAGWLDGWDAATGYTKGKRNIGQMNKVVAQVGSVLTLETPLYESYPNAWCTRMYAQGPENSGVEDLTVYATNTGSMKNFYLNGADSCWLYRVKGDFTDGDHVDADWAYGLEIRKCRFKDGFIHTSGSYDNGIFLRLKTAKCLIVDNIIERSHISICTEWGASGNVIAYNYTVGEYDASEAGGNRALQMGISVNHGAHPNMNLVEGNITSHIIIDSYWGTSTKALIARNWVRGHDSSHSPYDSRSAAGSSYELTQARRMIDIWDGQTKISVVGNILGDSFTGTGSGTTYKVTNPTARPYDSQIYEWSTGYATTSDGGGNAILTAPTATLIDHGNYSTKNASQTFDAGIADHTIPNSYFLGSKPAWFYSLAWPVFTITAGVPATTPAITDIPAGYRYVNGTDPSGSTDTTPPAVTITVPTSSSTASTATSAITISGTASDETALSSVTVAMTGATTGSVTITGTTSWSGSTTLNPGVTTLTSTAVDTSGNSTTDSLAVTYTAPAIFAKPRRGSAPATLAPGF